MGESNVSVHCKFCDGHHRPRFLCNPAKRVLDGMVERGMSFNMPTLEFPEPLPGIEQQLGMNPGDQLVSQIVIKAALVPFAGTVKPGVVLTGRAARGEVLPQWLYAGNDEDMRAFAALAADIAEMAIRRAKAGKA